MQRCALAGQQVTVDGLGHQRVAEGVRVAAIPLLLDELLVDRVPQGGHDLALADAGDALQQIEFEPLAHHRGDLDHPQVVR